MNQRACAVTLSMLLLLLSAAPGGCPMVGPGSEVMDRFDASLLQLHDALELGDPGARDVLRFKLAQGLVTRKLPLLAVPYYAEIIREGERHPHFFVAVEALVRIQGDVREW